MNATEVNSLIWGLLGGLLSVAGAVIGVSNWLHAKLDTLKTRQQEGESRLQLEIEKLRATAALDSSAEFSKIELIEYKTTSNRELIEHRTSRFRDELQAAEGRLAADILDIKSFLERTTSFQNRAVSPIPIHQAPSTTTDI